MGQLHGPYFVRVLGSCLELVVLTTLSVVAILVSWLLFRSLLSSFFSVLLRLRGEQFNTRAEASASPSLELTPSTLQHEHVIVHEQLLLDAVTYGIRCDPRPLLVSRVQGPIVGRRNDRGSIPPSRGTRAHCMWTGPRPHGPSLPERSAYLHAPSRGQPRP